MNITTTSQPLADLKTDLLVLLFFENDKSLQPKAKTLDKALNQQISMLLKEDFSGRLGETELIYGGSQIQAKRVLLLGLGAKKQFDSEQSRIAGSKLPVLINRYKIKSLSLVPVKNSVEPILEGLLLADYKFAPYKTPENREAAGSLENIEFVLENARDRQKVGKAATATLALVNAIYAARDLGNHPANVATPSHLAKHAEALARSHKNIRVKILHNADIKKEKMEAFLSVARGSDEEPKFIVLEYSAKKSAPKVVLAGKGITFDSGGINLKPSEKIEEMKFDMSGAAAVLGTIQAASELKLPVNLIGLIPATENLPSGKATKPGDVIRSRSGKTIEVVNTDAEGRLVLSDALDYAKKYKPDLVIDFATLTGAIVVALGDELIGTFGNSDKYIQRLKAAAKSTGEKIWPMPLEKNYLPFIKSDIADLKNVGTHKYGDSISAALFLQQFTDYPWIHLDIAGTAWATREKPYRPKGATGSGIHLAVEFLKNFKR